MADVLRDVITPQGVSLAVVTGAFASEATAPVVKVKTVLIHPLIFKTDLDIDAEVLVLSVDYHMWDGLVFLC